MPKTITEEGLEFTYATNYVAPFLLTDLLLGKIQMMGRKMIKNFKLLKTNYNFFEEDI